MLTSYSRAVQNQDDKTKFYILTINAADEDPEGNDLERSISDIEELFERGEIEFVVGSWERGEIDGRIHLQVYIIFKERKYARWVSARIYRSFVLMSDFRKAKGGIEYCDNPTKPGYVKKAIELGQRPGVTQGKRTDLETVDQAIASNEVRTRDQVNDLRVSVAATKANWVGYRLARAAKERYLGSNRYANCGEQLAWAIYLDDWLTKVNPDNRVIVLLIDRVGGHGKTRFTYEYERSNPAKQISYLTSAPKRDMAEAILDETEVCFIDIARARAPYMDTVWAFVEELKNGKTMKEKYGSVMSYHPLMHIVVFMNEKPQFGPLRDQYSLGGIVGNVGSRVEYDQPPEDKPIPLSHDRLLVWDFQEQPLLVAPLLEENRHFFPPFTRFDSTWKEYEYIPPEVQTSGPEFSSDEAGDGPQYSTALKELMRRERTDQFCQRCFARFNNHREWRDHTLDYTHCLNYREVLTMVKLFERGVHQLTTTDGTYSKTFRCYGVGDGYHERDNSDEEAMLSKLEQGAGVDTCKYFCWNHDTSQIICDPACLSYDDLFFEIDEVDFNADIETTFHKMSFSGVVKCVLGKREFKKLYRRRLYDDIREEFFDRLTDVPILPTKHDFFTKTWWKGWQYDEKRIDGPHGPVIRGYRMLRKTPFEDRTWLFKIPVNELPDFIADDVIAFDYDALPCLQLDVGWTSCIDVLSLKPNQRKRRVAN